MNHKNYDRNAEFPDPRDELVKKGKKFIVGYIL